MDMDMEGEVANFILVWILVVVSLVYSYIIGNFIPKGTPRLLALSIVICLFLWLPLHLTTMNLGGFTSFFIAWLANFKLLLFAYGKGPLASDPPPPLSRFIPMACLPIKPLTRPIQVTKITTAKTTTVFAKVLLFGLLLKVYDYSEYIHPYLKMSLYCIHMYLALEIMLAMIAHVARTLVTMELEPQFDEPYLATSLQDFWGKRWNLMVTTILHPTIYDPVRSISLRLLPRRWAAVVAVVATFLVSGLMHEFIFYNIGRLRPTGEVTCFFLLHGLLLSCEICLKRMARGKLHLPPILSRPLTLGTILATCFWLFFPPFLRFKPYVRGCQEAVAFLEFLATGRLISPDSTSCPFLLS